MVELIGLATLVGLTWLLASAMANESDAERRRLAARTGDDSIPSGIKHAA